MTVDRDTTAESERAAPVAEVSSADDTRRAKADDTRRTDGAAATPTVSTATVVAYAVAGAAVLGWFLFGWLVLQQGFIDSLGESAGAAFALLLIVSIVGTVRRGRRR
ncbi:hypothetical protein GA0070618_1509 [Micromonospora echinospora]|uniref:Uncharacterized protein n=1 Tax=Micromonospora echinospora TaxID=1877 RepID=A0A1C4VS03_MICEC|nr:hypothetical protein GA0070618_1509 [Micromonospora echinospora]